MKKTRILTLIIVSIAMLFTLASCSEKGGEVVYEMEQEGLKAVNKIEYDGKENITKLIMNTETTFPDDATAAANQEMLDLQEPIYKEQKGLDFNGEIKDNKMLVTFTYDMKTYIEENKESEDNPFSTLADKDGNLKLETIVKNLEDNGFKKK